MSTCFTFRFRAFSSERRTASQPLNFIDGALVERFLRMTSEQMTSVVEGHCGGERIAGWGVDALKALVESVIRMR